MTLEQIIIAHDNLNTRVLQLEQLLTDANAAGAQAQARIQALQAQIIRLQCDIQEVADDQDDPSMIAAAQPRFFQHAPPAPPPLIQLEDQGWDPGTDTAGALPPVQDPWDEIGDGAAWSGVASPDFDQVIATETSLLGRNAADHSKIDVGLTGYYAIGYSFVIDYPDGSTSNKQQIKSRVIRDPGGGAVELPASTAWVTDTRRDAWQVGSSFIARLVEGDFIQLQIGRYEYAGVGGDWACLTGSPQIWAVLLRRDPLDY
jgi:hypothetical protein